MSTFNFPTLLKGPQGAGAMLVANTGVNTSPLTGATQSISRQGSRLVMTLNFNRRPGPDAAELRGFLAGLYGQEHLVLYEDPTHVQRGVLSGTPLVDGASQVGQSLDIDGVGSVSDWIKRGDMLSFSNGTYTELKIVTADVTSSGGDATIPISPEIHISPANNAVVDVIVPIVGTWRLKAADGAAWDNEPSEDGARGTFQIEFVEYIGG